MALVNEWLRLHDRNLIDEARIQAYRKKKEKQNEVVDEDRKLKSEMYKARLKKLVESMPHEEEAPPQQEEEEEEVPEEETTRKLRLGTVAPVMESIPELDTKIEMTEMKLSPLIEKMMEYKWFPDDKVP